MAENKTRENDASVEEFLESVTNQKRVSDARTIIELMKKITGQDPKMWGPSIVGFDSYHYKYDSGREGDSFVSGLSPRKANLVVYITPGFKQYDDLLARLGKFKSSVSCLYINKLADVDMEVLEELIAKSYAFMKEKYPTTA